MKQQQVKIHPLKEEDLEPFWRLAFSRPNAQWRKWNAPYFHETLPTKAEFLSDADSWVEHPFRWVITVDDQMVGSVSAYYEDDELRRWLETGIVIYADDLWGQHVGRQAFTQWLDHLFEVVALPHIGFTTWSGNERMMRLGARVGMREEARIRQVRFWNEHYYDSVKYGILRSEWDQQKLPSRDGFLK